MSTTQRAELATKPRTPGQAATTMSAIKDYILHQGLGPGDPLPTESQICDRLGVSRSSVREAVRTLSALDIVEVRHGHGTFVGNVSMHPMVELLVFRGMLNPGDDYRALTEIVEVRQALDQAFAPSVCEAWKGEEDLELHTAVDEMEERAGHGKSFPEQDRFFHSRLLAPLENKLFRQLTEAFWDVHMITAPRLAVPRPHDIQDTARAHRDMLVAAEAGDVAEYQAAVEAHYLPLLKNLRGATEAR